MKLTIQEIRRITFGVVSVEENLGTFSFHRFTKEQTEAYARHNIDHFNKTFATAGVRFSFYTNASRMCFDYRLTPGSSRMFGWFDVYEDGVMTSHFGGEGKLFTSGHADIRLGSGEKRVEIYFPWSKVAFLSDIELDGELISPCKRSRTMLNFGDSITHGYDAIYPSLTYASLIAHELDADSVNKGIGGEIFFPELSALPDPVRPDIITAAYGTNDWNICAKDHLTSGCLSFYTNLCRTYPAAKIFAITPIWRADGDRETKYAAPHSSLYETMRELLSDLPVTVINGYTLTPHTTEFYSDAYLHPNNLGFSVYARELTKQIKKHL